MTRALGQQTSVIIRQEHEWGTISADTSNDIELSYRSCNLGSTKNTFQSETINSTRAVVSLADGNVAVQGSITMDLVPEGIEVLLRHLLGKGTITTTGSGPYTHVLKGASETLTGLTIEKAFTNIGQYFVYKGCRVNSMNINLIQEGYHDVTFDFLGKNETINNASFSTSAYSPTKSGYTGYQCTVSIDGNLEQYVVSGSINIQNNVETDGYVLGSQERASAEYGKRECSGDITMFFEDVTLYEKYLAGTEVPIVFNFTNGYDSLKITFPKCKLSGESPNIDSTGGINLKLGFNARYFEDDATDVTFEITNDLASIPDEPSI